MFALESQLNFRPPHWHPSPDTQTHIHTHTPWAAIARTHHTRRWRHVPRSTFETDFDFDFDYITLHAAYAHTRTHTQLRVCVCQKFAISCSFLVIVSHFLQSQPHKLSEHIVIIGQPAPLAPCLSVHRHLAIGSPRAAHIHVCVIEPQEWRNSVIKDSRALAPVPTPSTAARTALAWLD